MTEMEDKIRYNLESIRERIGRTATRSGRKTEDITLIAASKTVAPDRIKRALEAGITDLGENKVQELTEKYDILGKRCRWHLIGHLQTNKVKYIIDKVTLIHSVDSIELVKELDLRAGKAGRVVNILVQVNVSGEETKFGIAPDEVRAFLENTAVFTNVKVKGLMTIAPYATDIETIRYVFRDLHKLFIDIRKENIDNIDMDVLSMGMSNDFEIAIEEGSNMVRIGSAIFGERNYNI